MVPENGNRRRFKRWVLGNVVVHTCSCGHKVIPLAQPTSGQSIRLNAPCEDCQRTADRRYCDNLLEWCDRLLKVTREQDDHRRWQQARFQALCTYRSTQILLRLLLGLVPARIRARGLRALSKVWA